MGSSAAAGSWTLEVDCLGTSPGFLWGAEVWGGRPDPERSKQLVEQETSSPVLGWMLAKQHSPCGSKAVPLAPLPGVSRGTVMGDAGRPETSAFPSKPLAALVPSARPRHKSLFFYKGKTLLCLSDSRLREAGAEVVYCLTRGAPKGPNLPRARLNHQDALFPGHGKATHSQAWAGEPAWLGVRGDATLQTPAFTDLDPPSSMGSSAAAGSWTLEVDCLGTSPGFLWGAEVWGGRPDPERSKQLVEQETSSPVLGWMLAKQHSPCGSKAVPLAPLPGVSRGTVMGDAGRPETSAFPSKPLAALVPSARPRHKSPFFTKAKRFFASVTPVYEKQGPKWCIASPGGPRRVQTYPGLGSTTRMPFSPDTGKPRTAIRGRANPHGSGSVETPLSKHLLSQVPPAGILELHLPLSI
ncbi:hypothetical protein ISCGN_019125 [Ixodes scapularis]